VRATRRNGELLTMFEQVESYNIARLEQSQTHRAGSCIDCGGRAYADDGADGIERSKFFCVDCDAENGWK